MISAQEALERLREGNQRFVSGVRSIETLMSPTRRTELVEDQTPFAMPRPITCDTVRKYSSS